MTKHSSCLNKLNCLHMKVLVFVQGKSLCSKLYTQDRIKAIHVNISGTDALY
jgi:hypothetical protein